MTDTISLPVWVFMILSFSTLLVFLRVVIFPLWASFWSARTRHVVEEVNPSLQLHMSSFTLSRRRVLADRLACDPVVEAGIILIARERGVSVEKVRRESWRFAWDIVPDFNPYFYFRTGYRMARRCLRSLYELKVAFVDKDKMADVNDKSAVLFVINHRSNIDYAVANYLTASHTMLSFGVGEWSRVWPIQPLFRMAGGYFVRRDSGDPLYRLMLKRYVQMATEARVPHAIFLEGQLSPDGGLSSPRLGLLSYVTEKFDPENSPDLVFMPIGLNYDRIPEDITMQRFSSKEFRAKGKRYILLQGIVFAFRVCWEALLNRQAFGCACANFGNPISFSKWLEEQNVEWPKLSRKQRFVWISKFGEELIENISAVVPATPVAILSRIWFFDTSQKFDRTELETRFSAICSQLRENNCHVVLVHETEKQTLDHALKFALGRNLLIKDNQEQYKINPKMVSLAIYSGNSLSQHLKDKPETPQF